MRSLPVPRRMRIGKADIDTQTDASAAYVDAWSVRTEARLQLDREEFVCERRAQDVSLQFLLP